MEVNSKGDKTASDVQALNSQADAYIWASTSRARNKAVHALHGNPTLTRWKSLVAAAVYGDSLSEKDKSTLDAGWEQIEKEFDAANLESPSLKEFKEVLEKSNAPYAKTILDDYAWGILANLLQRPASGAASDSTTNTPEKFQRLEWDLTELISQIPNEMLQRIKPMQDLNPPACMKTALPLGIDPEPAVDMLYSLFNVDVGEQVIEQGPGDSPGKVRIVVPLGPSGSGKTKFMFNLSLKRGSFLLFTNFDKPDMKRSIEKGMQFVCKQFNTSIPSVDPCHVGPDGYICKETESHAALLKHYQQRDNAMQAVFLRRFVSQLYVLAWLRTKSDIIDFRDKSAPHMWLRFQQIAEAIVIAPVEDAMAHLDYDQLTSLCKNLKQKAPVVTVAGDEAQELLEIARNEVISRRDSATARTRFTKAGEIIQGSNSASAFSVACRAAEMFADICGAGVYFAGTSFLMMDALRDATPFMKQRFIRLRILPATAAHVKQLIQHYYHTSAVSDALLDSLCARLAGRLRPIICFLLALKGAKGSSVTDSDLIYAFERALAEAAALLNQSSTYLHNTVLLDESGVRYTRWDVLTRLANGQPLVLPEKDAQTISATFIDLAEGEGAAMAAGRPFVRRSNEPLIALACRDNKDLEGRNALPRIALQSFEDEVTGKDTKNHGWLGETCLEHVLHHIGLENLKALRGGEQLKPLTSYKLFRNLPPEFTNYTIVAEAVCHEPDKWADVLQRNGQLHDIQLILSSINTLMRPDILAILIPLKAGLQPGLLIAGVKLYNANLHPDIFYDNYLTTDLQRLFVNEYSQGLGAAEARSHAQEFAKNFKGLALRVLFEFGGVSGTVDLQKQYWQAADKSHVVVIDSRDSDGLQQLLLPTLFLHLKIAAFPDGKIRRTRPTNNTQVPEKGVVEFTSRKRKEFEKKVEESKKTKKAKK